ncbi:MAG: hypothetical protein ACPGYK_02025 [Flavobacteriales bacterium]
MQQFLIFTMILIGVNTLHAQAPVITWNTAPIEVAENDFGHLSPRMVLDGDGWPVITFGKNGSYHCATWNTEESAFNPPVVLVESGVFLSDSEGPRMAAHGDSILVTYMVSGQWATGARGLFSGNGGQTWSEPFPLVSPDVTEDHFMPVPAFDQDGVPFVAIKLGNPPNVSEGLLRPADEITGLWLDAISTSENAAGEAICECCPSNPFFHNSRYWNVVRNNNDNIRDMWLLGSSEDNPTDWPLAMDLDNTDWWISGCPATGAQTAGPTSSGEHWSVFMSAGGDSGMSLVYLTRMTLDEEASTSVISEPLTPNQFSNSPQNHPSISVSSNWAAVAWEQNTAGYDIQLVLSNHEGASLWDNAINLTEAQGGQHRQPTVILDGDALHLAWKNSMTGSVQYMCGFVNAGTTGIGDSANDSPCILHADGTSLHLGIPNHWDQPIRYVINDIGGRAMRSGHLRMDGTISLESTPNGPTILQLFDGKGKTATLKWAH